MIIDHADLGEDTDHPNDLSRITKNDLTRLAKTESLTQLIVLCYF